MSKNSLIFCVKKTVSDLVSKNCVKNSFGFCFKTQSQILCQITVSDFVSQNGVKNSVRNGVNNGVKISASSLCLRLGLVSGRLDWCACVVCPVSVSGVAVSGVRVRGCCVRVCGCVCLSY